jgi:hypothetical protein
LSARERRDTNWNPSRSNCGLLRRKPEDIVVWSPSLVMSLQIDTATFISEESSASGSVVANGLGGHHGSRATVTNRASNRVRSQLRVAVQGVAVPGGLDVGEDQYEFDPFRGAALLDRPTARRAAST